ncbi:MAG TPA: LysR family transcriptional regulator [Streptosporangiaceae bacterium]|nr:LysR family transcriptional regulator [Streptosporangiaceae bacterium]
MLDLGRLRVLRELKLRGTVGAVAEALGYSPSAVSQQLAQLQKDVKVPLVERAGRRLRLTEAGEVLAGQAEILLAQAQHAEESTLAAGGRVAGVMRVVGHQVAVLNLIAPALPGLRRRHPDLVVEVIDEESEDVLRKLALQEVDLVLYNEYVHMPLPRAADLEPETLLTEPMRLVLPEGHRLARSGAVRLADLEGDSWVSTHSGTRHAEMMRRACAEIGGYRPTVRHHSNDVRVLLNLIAAGQAVGLLPELAQVANQPGVVVRGVADADLRRRIVAWRRRGAEARPSVKAVLEALRATADELVARRPGLSRERPSPPEGRRRLPCRRVDLWSTGKVDAGRPE